MKGKGKIKLTLLLVVFCMGMTVPAATVPAAKRAYESIGWFSNNKKNCTMEIEAGQTINILNYFYLLGTDSMEYDGISEKKAITCTSSNKKVATVGKKTGILKTKKKGTAKITLKFRGKKYVCTLKVKKKGSLIKGNFKKLFKQYQVIKKYKNSKITASNFSKIAKAVQKYSALMEKCNLDPVYGVTYNNRSRIYFYQDVNIDELSSKVLDFADAKMKNAFTITKITVNSASKMTLTLSKAVTALQIDILDYMNMSNFTEKLPEDLLFFTCGGDVDPEDVDENNLYIYARGLYSLFGTSSLKKGSKQIILTRSSGSGDSFKDVSLVTCDASQGYFRFKNKSIYVIK